MVLGSTAQMPGPIFLNIMFTIVLSLLVLIAHDRIKIRPLFWLLFIIACVVSLYMDLMFMAVLGTLLYHIIQSKESRRRTLPGVITGIFYGILGLLGVFGVVSYQALLAAGQYDAAAEVLASFGGYEMLPLMMATPTFAIGAFAGAILIRNYNGERGRKSKWLFYGTYVVHLAVIALIMVLTGITTFNLFGFITF